ncbi:MAG: DUF3383 family protein, partial [Cyanobacteria bacterium REEB65]|nr:DUF3383 family protein [Cyanobacteria bacterium REEB65]
LYIGFWAETATHGQLICGALTAAEQAMSNWTSITTGAFKVAIDGGAATNVTGCDFSAQTTLNGVATVITTQLAAAALAATCVWNGQQFVIKSSSTGATSTVSALTAPGSGANISAQLMGTSATLQLIVAGIAAEEPLTALEIIEQMVRFYMVMFAASPDLSDSQIEAIAAYVEGDQNNPHLYLLTSSDANALVSSATTDIGYILRQLNYKRTGYQYSSTNAYACASIMGRMATVDYTAIDATITMAYKQEPGVTPESLTSSQADSLDAKGYNYYGTYDNGESILFGAYVAAPDFYLDDIQGTDAYVGAVRTALFNALFQTPTKIPQTDAGVHVLVNAINGVNATFLANGQLGPGTWTFNGFGNLKTGDFLETGAYVFASSIASQSSADRLARQSPPIQVAAIYAGAVQKVGVTINVQR